MGKNSYCARPSGEGLAIFLSLWVELEGELNPHTGFVVNLTDIDRNVRDIAVPVFDYAIRGCYKQNEYVDLRMLVSLLSEAFELLKDNFEAKLTRMILELNPFRRIAIDSENPEMLIYSEKFEFAAMHKLWNESFSSEENFEIFGKCANPAGHGHNYIVEVRVEVPVEIDFSFGNFQKIVDENFIDLVDHKNLNVDVEYFCDKNPTVENITTFGWEVLKNKFAPAKLESVTVWENDRAYCSYSG